ncbi:hypothetical protein AVP42_02586 [Agromyces sp. NDB4Y10]|uniref:DUF305 domain-containing protein n=1 Tax=Agromyces sp. NDB4Y10 TaxID=1775951 RepID=UPI0007B2F660|nr:DUF305 domain-containing protein [Agromyces sp. NDB4Y10]KZE92432.1 hypothetical protein AVP42_02586 [Agromyces sp. NDB4Y10]
MSENRNAADEQQLAQRATHDEHAEHSSESDHQDGQQSKHTMKMYLQFGAMILTSMVVMYFVMFAGSWEWTHIRFSQSRIFMAITMGGTMGLVMLAWMLGMYKSTKGNIAVVAASVLLIGGGIALDRTQATVNDTSFMRAMIPHHSLAITRSERFQNEDIRVCELAVAISEAQRREITEMDWLIRDIEENGPATTAAEAESRAVPDFSEPADRTCPAE